VPRLDAVLRGQLGLTDRFDAVEVAVAPQTRIVLGVEAVWRQVDAVSVFW
jgi:hypothetical protein